MSQSSSPDTAASAKAAVSGMSSVLNRNIADMRARAEREAKASSRSDKVADAVTAFAGSMVFVAIHLAIVAAWVAANVGVLPGVPRFDRTFVILATVASVEAIFISTFVLISQNRAAEKADRRAELDLQINLLAEHEISEIARLLVAVADKLGVQHDGDVVEAAQDIEPQRVLDALRQIEREDG